MNKSTVAEEFLEYQDKIGDRKGLYESVTKKYDVKRVLYPGSHIDIAPSLVIPQAIYVDNFKGAIKFFRKIEPIKEYINENKEYEAPCDIVFLGQDYTEALDIEPVDLIISQYGGFVGQATKKYLKTGGILLCNDSHGDATLAKFDDDFEFIGVVGKNNKIIRTHLDTYFVLPSSQSIDLAKINEQMKGPKYKSTAENYIFRKIK
ncbi:hypothetical protein SAMN04488102_104105 [Alkalibacterium subtropicum]|uniref:Uncharacterized protein n=1 Tax=Alkalibacterium subtropicum TaxID=753702 RepID=A0A1I1HK29_9LACT|nr:hypothetical protein [Alkalibacterium subtropicum]SFC24427.1 hypothetical protein SAMN04488102_104105 [Alkalibacterium subtropicum]